MSRPARPLGGITTTSSLGSQTGSEEEAAELSRQLAEEATLMQAVMDGKPGALEDLIEKETGARPYIAPAPEEDEEDE